MGCHVWDGAGNNIAPGAISAAGMTSPAADQWVKITGTFIVPNCSYIRPYFQRLNGGAGGNVYFGEPYIGRKQKGSDVTGINTALFIAGQGLLATKSLIDAVSYLGNLVVENRSLIDNSTFRSVVQAVDFAHYRTTPGNGSWYNITNGSTTLSLAITTAPSGAQRIKITLVMAMQGDGGSADNLSVRMLRNGAQIGQVWDNIQILNDRIMTYTFIFWDEAPAVNTTYTYTPQWMPIVDGWPYWDNISFDIEGKWK
jgi:hypothetical protein